MSRSGRFDRSPIALLALLVPLCAYVASICPYPDLWDTAEMQTAPYMLGIPHSTGFPLFVIGGWIFTHIFVIGTVAWRMNFFCGLALAATAAMIYQTARALGATRTGALLGSFIFAAGKVVWDKAALADVHALAVLCTVVALYCLVRFLDTRGERWLLGAAVANGLGMAVHPNAIWTLPAVALAYVAGGTMSWRTTLKLIVCLAAPLAFYAYEPLRSLSIAATHVDPVQSIPWPSGMQLPSLIWDTNQTRTLVGLREQLLAPSTNPGGGLSDVFAVWRFPAFAAFWSGYALAEVGAGALIAAGIGFFVLFEMNPKALLVLGVGGFAAIPTAVDYADREADIARYFLASFAVIAIFIAFAPRIGLLVKRLRGFGPVASAVLVFVAWQLASVNSYHFNARSGLGSQPVIDMAARTLPSRAIVLASWNDATALAYGQDVEGVLPDRIIVPRGPGALQASIAVWSRSRPVYVFADGTINPEISSLPHRWITEVPGADLGRHVYHVCGNPHAC